MSKQLLTVAAQLKTYHPLQDGSVTITFETQEVDKPFQSDLFDLHRQFGWLLFSPNHIRMDSVPIEDTKPLVGETPSKKMRSTIYALYAAMGAPYGTTGFEKFYAERMERLRSQILGDLQALDRQP